MSTIKGPNAWLVVSRSLMPPFFSKGLKIILKSPPSSGIHMTYYTSKFVMFKRGEMKLVLSEGMGGLYTLVRNPWKLWREA